MKKKEVKDLMKEVLTAKENELWLFTSNLSVKRGTPIRLPDGRITSDAGENVMGRGSAAAFKKAFPELPLLYGRAIQKNPEFKVLTFLLRGRVNIGAFPVKPAKVIVMPDKSNIVPHMRAKVANDSIQSGWMSMADPEIIKQSWKSLKGLHDKFEKIFIPMFPGTGNGGIPFEEGKKLVPKWARESDKIWAYCPATNK